MLYSDREDTFHHSLFTVLRQLLSAKSSETQPSYWPYKCPSIALVKAQGSFAGVLFFLPFCHSRKIFNDPFVAARVDFGIFRLPKSSGTGRHVLFGQKKKSSKFIPKMFFSYANFQHSRKHNCYEIY